MRRACLLLSLGAMVLLAANQKPATKTRCLRIDRVERIIPKDVDKAMVIQPKSPSGDDKMVLPSPPFCRDVGQGRPKNCRIF